VAGYRVYYGDVSRVYTDSLDAQTNTTVVIPGFSPGTYYFAVRSYNGTGELSAYSQERSLVMDGLDIVPPAVSSMSPAQGATDVAVNAVVLFVIADDRSGVDQNTLVVTVNGTPVQSLSVSGNPSAYVVTARPAEDFPGLSSVLVEVAASDLATTPNRMDASWTFDTGDVPVVDTDAPVISGQQPPDGARDVASDAEIRIRITDALMGIDAASISFRVNGLPVNYATEGDAFDMTLVYGNDSGFAPGSTVDVSLSISDLASPANWSSVNYSFTVTAGSEPVAANEGVVVPDGYWVDDPARPLEVRNLPASWTVRIFDAAGWKVREHTNDAGDGQDWTWDFMNDHGQRVTRALYLIRVTGPDGQIRRTGRFVVQTDR